MDQVHDEISHLGLRELLVTTSTHPSNSWHKIIKPNTNSWCSSGERATRSFANGRTDITTNRAATAAARLKLSDLVFDGLQIWPVARS